MTRGEELFFVIAIVLDMIGPIALLLLLRRWTRRWWIASVGTLIIAPFAAFEFIGGLAWVLTYFRVVIDGDTSIPDGRGQTVPDYLSMTFVISGGYGVLFAGTGFLITLPLISLWAAIHRKSFNRAIRNVPSKNA
jgi:hypothetical protein